MSSNACPARVCGARLARGGECECPATRQDPTTGRWSCGRHNRRAVCPECPICLCELGSKCRKTVTGCGHLFHSRCLRGWVRREPLTCPMCRRTCLDTLCLLGPGLVPRLQGLVRTVPPPPDAFFPGYMRAQLESKAVVDALGCGASKLELLIDIACECFTQNNFFTTVRALEL